MQEKHRMNSALPATIQGNNLARHPGKIKSTLVLITTTALVAAATLLLPAPSAQAHDTPYNHYHPSSPGGTKALTPYEQDCSFFGCPESGLGRSSIRFRPHLYIGLGPELSVIAADKDFPDLNRFGYGMALNAGLRASQVFGFEMNLFSGFHQGNQDHKNPTNGSASNLGFAVKLHSPSPGNFSPYLQLGLGAMTFYDRDRDYSLGGLAWQLGGGAEYTLGKYTSLGARVLYRSATVDNEHDMEAEYIERAYLGVLSAGFMLNLTF